MLLPKLSNEDEAEDILLIFNDITEKQEMERELLHSEKLQLVGQLAAGFAHEIRNPLTTIRGFLHLYESSDSPPQAYNQLMIKEIDRVNSIIEELLHLASPKAFDKVNTNITRLLNEIHLFYQSEAKAKKIDFQTNVEPLPNVYLDPDKLHQVLLNLVKNGLEAIGTDGRLTISARAEMGRNKIVIEVIDSGNGMDKQTIEKNWYTVLYDKGNRNRTRINDLLPHYRGNERKHNSRKRTRGRDRFYYYAANRARINSYQQAETSRNQVEILVHQDDMT